MGFLYGRAKEVGDLDKEMDELAEEIVAGAGVGEDWGEGWR